ncbi:MAG: histidine phosphatase family protein [Rhodobacteraceae bacterium]|nr:histidine phosphatase family protein [Paracoccaceae bacterium]
MTRFWWVRHGPTHASGMVGWSDLPADLSDTAQLERLDAYLPKTAVVISSDLSRAIATADAIGNRRRRLPNDPDLREINFGDWENRHFTEIAASDPDLIRAFWDDPGEVRAPGGESWNQTSARVSGATDRLLAGHEGADIVVVAHFGAILTQLQRALGVPPRKVLANRIENLSVTRISFDGAWHAGPINYLP